MLQYQCEEDAKYVYIKRLRLVQVLAETLKVSIFAHIEFSSNDKMPKNDNLPHGHADDLGMSYAASQCLTNITICQKYT